jgi:uncharacterized protein YqhQ
MTPPVEPLVGGGASRGGAEKLRLGGMALRNGLLVHGPSHWAASVRAPDGTIRTASGRKPRLTAADEVPGVRGVVRLAEAFALIPMVKAALPEARLPFQSAGVAGAMAGATAMAAAVRRASPGPVGEAMVGAVSVAPALLALRGGELAEYHGVEHKAIAAYEDDAEDAAEAAKEHERCGSHLVAPMLASQVAGTALLRGLTARPSPLARGAVSLASVAAAVEVFAWSERHSGSALSRALRRPGFAIQRALGTREPSERQLEVGRAALARLLELEQAAEA